MVSESSITVFTLGTLVTSTSTVMTGWCNTSLEKTPTSSLFWVLVEIRTLSPHDTVKGGFTSLTILSTVKSANTKSVFVYDRCLKTGVVVPTARVLSHDSIVAVVVTRVPVGWVGRTLSARWAFPFELPVFVQRRE